MLDFINSSLILSDGEIEPDLEAIKEAQKNKNLKINFDLNKIQQQLGDAIECEEMPVEDPENRFEFI